MLDDRPIYPFTNHGHRLGLYRPRVHDICGVVIHTTGAGPFVRWKKQQRFDSPYDAALYMYARSGRFAAHYLVDGETGSISQGTPEGFVSWHVGSKGSWMYRAPGWDRKCQWWRSRWPDIESPRYLLDGALWRTGSANELTVGIEVAPPKSGPRNAWTGECWESLGWLVRKICGDYGIPVESQNVITHSDAHPRSRTTKSDNPWDPGPIQWNGRQSVYRFALENA